MEVGEDKEGKTDGNEVGEGEKGYLDEFITTALEGRKTSAERMTRKRTENSEIQT